ncbi:MAG: TonB-dependent receptor [Paludibacter sp.]|nr:TonB-dependent receptor [Paludibacter sp.]
MNETQLKQHFIPFSNWIKKIGLFILLLAFSFFNGYSFENNTSFTSKEIRDNYEGIVIKGKVTDNNGEPLPGVNVTVKGATTGTITDINGNYAITVKTNDIILIYSFIGYNSQEKLIGNKTSINVTLSEDVKTLDEIVVIGYGQQKKQTVVGAVSSVSNEKLQSTGGVANLAQALTGQLAGVTTMLSTGEPGNDDPKILIRGMSTWNNAEPLVLVDGIERKMNDIDVNEVESVSVLKDASATAIFGVKGAEGVILITTKRGKVSTPKLSVQANSSVKFLSRTPKELDSYEGLMFRNKAIEHELPVKEDGWNYYTPLNILNRYRIPQAPGDEFIFPNVDWKKEMLKDFALSHHLNLNIIGGTDFAKYFGSLSYTHEGDLMKSGLENNKGYKSQWAYNRFNFRTNIDFNITPTTVLSTNLSGYVGTKLESFYSDDNHVIFNAFYKLAPNVFPVRFPDGAWGFTPNSNTGNPVAGLSNTGVEKIVRTQINTDFKLKQMLDFITPGLSAQATFSYDNRFYSSGGIFDSQNLISKYIDPGIANKQPGESDNNFIFYDPKIGINDFDFFLQPATYMSEGVRTSDNLPFGRRDDLQNTFRKIFYQFQIDYSRQFDKHSISAMAVMNREQYAQGSTFPTYREDWAGRITYNYNERYLIESNAAYNGSERFARSYRFGFFPSMGIGWVVSKEPWLEKISWLDKFKLRYTIGKAGNDRFNSPRWAYETNWVIEPAKTPFGTPTYSYSPYEQYSESVIGNPDLHWEVSLKQNTGIEIAALKNKINLNIEIFKDYRNDIFIDASQRNIPAYFGANPVSANLGKTETNGYEIEFRFNNTTAIGLHYWFNWAYSHAIDRIVYKEDPMFTPNYQKKAGFQISQTRSEIHDGYLNNWDDVYSSVYLATDNTFKLPGDLRIVDYNGDGIIDSYDIVPFGYPVRPQNTYNFSFGMEYKGFSAELQFYGVYNVNRVIDYLTPFSDLNQSLVYNLQRDSWAPEQTDRQWKAERFQSNSPDGTLYIVDASYLRLKTAEIAYTINKQYVKKLGINSAKIFLNGNNLLFWSSMPDDREDNSISVEEYYPTYRRINIGVNLDF